MPTKAEQIREIIPVDKWIQDEFYVGPSAAYIRPYVKEFIEEFNNATYVNEMGLTVPKRKFIATGASRTGKSYGARKLIQRILYEMSCWKNFPCLFGLDPNTTPKIFWLSYTLTKSKSTGLKQLIKDIDSVPYWQLPNLRRKQVETELIFPFCEILPGSQVEHIIGEDMLGCVLDEANVRKVAQGTEVEETQKMFQEMRQRSVMTFSKNGIWGGFSGIISSSTTSSSFVAIELEKAKKDGDTAIMEASVYEANPEQYSKEKFDVFIGNGTIAPFIVDQADNAIKTQIADTYGQTLEQFVEDNPSLIEPVPVSIRKFYEEDISFSLANMSGKVQTGTNKFINNSNIIKNLWNEDKSPLLTEIPEIGIYDQNSPFLIWNSDRAMEHYHGENVYLHIDASQKHDHTGFSALFYDREDNKIRSLLTASMFLNEEINDNQIDQEKILQLILYMRDNGVMFKKITGDHFAKDYLIPQCKKIFGNEYSDYYSVDITPAAYLTTLNFMKLKRYSIPYYKQLEYELSNLLYDRSTGKVDHPHNTDPNHPVYFKDCSDCFAAATQLIYVNEHVHYEDMLIEKETEKMSIPDDGFYSSISLTDDAEIEDELKLFQEGLYGFDEHIEPFEP